MKIEFHSDPAIHSEREEVVADVLILNTAAIDLRRKDFEFVDNLVGKGGLARCKTEDMPDYSQRQLAEWIEQGFGTAGGPGNTAPLIAKSGLTVSVGANLGKGDHNGLDAQGRFFYDVMIANHIDMSQIVIHPTLPTGTTFIHDTVGEDRGGIAYFPNANNDFDFGYFRKAVDKLEPKIVYYMYSGLSERGDANGGKDLAEFIGWCRDKGTVTIVDSHTLAGNPQELINSGKPVVEYKLLEPLLPEVDLFFTSSDEAKMIGNTLSSPRNWHEFSEHENNQYFLNFLSERFWQRNHRTRVFGVTVSSGAYENHVSPDGTVSGPSKIESKFMAGEVIDLVGAGDSFRAGLISYIAKNIDYFKSGTINFTEAVLMGNLFASLYIKAPLNDRYGNIKAYEQMLKAVQSTVEYRSLEALQEFLN